MPRKNIVLYNIKSVCMPDASADAQLRKKEILLLASNSKFNNWLHSFIKKNIIELKENTGMDERKMEK